MAELKPCPFCQERNKLCVEQAGKEIIYVFCGNCGAEGPVCGSREDAIDAWNKRS